MKKKILSGFCANGQHEGTKPSGKSGMPFPVCTCWTTCDCDCHTRITEMYESLGLPREEAMQNPEYSAYAKTQRDKFVMPDPVIVALDGLSNVGGGILPPVPEDAPTVPENGTLDPLGEPAPAPVVPRFAPTPTGRRARGQLEYDVLTVCIEYSNEEYDWELCTPKLVSERIGKKYAIEPPSTGAIDAVWNRWEALEFAVRDHKPSRFVRFRMTASVEVLERIKSEKKRAKKRQIAEQRRGIPRPPVRSKR